MLWPRYGRPKVNPAWRRCASAEEIAAALREGARRRWHRKHPLLHDVLESRAVGGFAEPLKAIRAMTTLESIYQQIEQDIWAWIDHFVTAKNEFYNYKFPPCPFAHQAVVSKTVDVQVWQTGNVREFIRGHALQMRDSPSLTTGVMAFPPKTRFAWGINDYVESLNAELISSNVFLNTGVTKTMSSRYPRLRGEEPYFIVIANSLAAVLSGSEVLDEHGLLQKLACRLLCPCGRAQSAHGEAIRKQVAT